MLPRRVETLTELADCLRRADTPRGRLALLGRMAAAVDPAVGAIIGQIPPRERDWADVAELLGSADPDAVKCRYGRDGGSL